MQRPKRPQQPEQAAQTIPGGAASAPTADAPPLPMRRGQNGNRTPQQPSASWSVSTGRVPERRAKRRRGKHRQKPTAKEKSSRLQFTDEERATPELERYIRKSDKAADRLDAAKAAIPKEKKLVRERTFDEATGKGKTRLHFEEQEKPIGKNKPHNNPLSRPAQEAGIFVHNKIHSVEKDNSGVEGAHKSEEPAERGAKYGARKVKEGYRSHKLKPYRAAAKAEKAAFKANANYPTKRHSMTTRRSPRQSLFPLHAEAANQAAVCKVGKAKRRKNGAESRREHKQGGKKDRRGNKKAIAFVGRHPAGVCIAVGALLLFIMISSGAFLLRGSMFSGMINGIVGLPTRRRTADLVAGKQLCGTGKRTCSAGLTISSATTPAMTSTAMTLTVSGITPMN